MASKLAETDKTEQSEQKQKVMERIAVSVKVMSDSEISDVHNAKEHDDIDRQKSIKIQLAMDNQTHSEDESDETDKTKETRL